MAKSQAFRPTLIALVIASLASCAPAPDQFEARYTFFTTTPPPEVKSLSGGWLPAGSGVLTERITLAADGRAFDSSITLVMFDTSGKPVAGGGEASAHGTRAGL